MGRYTYSVIGILFFVVPVLLFGLAALIGRYKNLDYSLIAWRKLSVGQRLFSISMALMLTAFTVIFVYQTISTFGPKSLMILIPMGLGIGWFLKAAVRYYETSERRP